MKVITTAFLGLLYFIIFSPQALAFSVSPAITELEANPGDTLRTNIRIQNTGDTRRFYVFTIQKFVAKGELGQQEFLPPTETSGLPEWMFFDRPVLELAAGESVSLPIIIRVPATAKPGGHYAAVLFSEQSQMRDGAVGIVPRTGSLVLLTVRGNILKSYSVDQLSTSPEHPSHLPVHFTARLSNTGNVHIQPEGQLRIKNMFGNTVASFPLNASKGRILPSSGRTFQMTWQNHEPNPEGFMSGLAEEVRNFAFGKYTAELTVRAGADEKTVTQDVWIWPWRIFVSLIVVILFVVALLVGRKKLSE